MEEMSGYDKRNEELFRLAKSGDIGVRRYDREVSRNAERKAIEEARRKKAAKEAQRKKLGIFGTKKGKKK